MNGIKQLKLASEKSKEIIDSFIGQLSDEPDVVEARKKELADLTTDKLIQLVIGLEKPKVERAFKVEDVVKTILEAPECAIFNYDQIASMVHQVLPEAKTSSKSVASYASKRKEDWDIVSRTKLNLTHEDILSIAV